MSQREQVLQQAMLLTPEDRVYVADALEQSLPFSEFMAPEVAIAWETELLSRIAAYDRGEEQAEDVDAALQKIRVQLADYRARRVKS